MTGNYTINKADIDAISKFSTLLDLTNRTYFYTCEAAVLERGYNVTDSIQFKSGQIEALDDAFSTAIITFLRPAHAVYHRFGETASNFTTAINQELPIKEFLIRYYHQEAGLKVILEECKNFLNRGVDFMQQYVDSAEPSQFPTADIFAVAKFSTFLHELDLFCETTDQMANAVKILQGPAPASVFYIETYDFNALAFNAVNNYPVAYESYQQFVNMTSGFNEYVNPQFPFHDFVDYYSHGNITFAGLGDYCHKFVTIGSNLIDEYLG